MYIDILLLLLCVRKSRNANNTHAMFLNRIFYYWGVKKKLVYHIIYLSRERQLSNRFHELYNLKSACKEYIIIVFYNIYATLTRNRKLKGSLYLYRYVCIAGTPKPLYTWSKFIICYQSPSLWTVAVALITEDQEVWSFDCFLRYLCRP